MMDLRLWRCFSASSSAVLIPNGPGISQLDIDNAILLGGGLGELVAMSLRQMSYVEEEYEMT